MNSIGVELHEPLSPAFLWLKESQMLMRDLINSWSACREMCWAEPRTQGDKVLIWMTFLVLPSGLALQLHPSAVLIIQHCPAADVMIITVWMGLLVGLTTLSLVILISFVLWKQLSSVKNGKTRKIIPTQSIFIADKPQKGDQALVFSFGHQPAETVWSFVVLQGSISNENFVWFTLAYFMKMPDGWDLPSGTI